MAINRTGFTQTNTGLEIDKDVEARLTYTFDWSEWLETSDSITDVEYTAAARRNDPTPVVIHSSGIVDDTTYVEISGGQTDKSYLVTAKITTNSGLIDRRNFRLNVITRSA